LWSSLRPKADVDVVNDQDETRITDRSPSSRDTTPPPDEDDLEELTPPQLPVGALIQRILDTAEDAYLHLKRLPYEFDWAVEPPKVEGQRRETVVVLGTGWAAHALLKTIDTNQAKVVVTDQPLCLYAHVGISRRGDGRIPEYDRSHPCVQSTH
jgi:hypothetical protein